MKNVILIALGQTPDLKGDEMKTPVAVRFVFSKEDVKVLQTLKDEHPEYIVMEDYEEPNSREVVDSSTRFGVYMIKAPRVEELQKYMPGELK